VQAEEERVFRKRYLVLAVVALLIGYGLFDSVYPCSPSKVRAYGEQLERELEVYEGILTIAGSTSRIALAGPRQEMQRQRFTIQDIDAPFCLTEYHENVIKMMNSQEMGYEYFASDTSSEGEALASLLIMIGDTQLGRLRTQLNEIIEGKVPNLETSDEEATATPAP
jgi:hypothetical protein